MNAVVSLCHFCELHGPSVLFCTQAFRDHLNPTIEKLQKEVLESKPFYGPTELLISMQTGSDPSIQRTNVTCEGCTSMSSNLKRYLSNDHEARVSYISSQYPLHPELFSLVRQACVRSLSCEICPGREGPIYFGDDSRGHVLSHTFFMKDSQARGFQRWYSIIIVMMDKIFLLNSWPFLVKYIQKLVAELQEKAFKMYEKEQSEISERTLRLNSVTRMTFDNFRRQRGNAKARSLLELTGDPLTFALLHLRFTWILRAGGCRIGESLLEGLPSEDTVVDLEMQEETEEGFIKVNTKRIPDEFLSSMKESNSGQLDELSCETVIEENGIIVENLRKLYKVIGREMFLVLAYHTSIGNQIILKGPSRCLIQSIIMCLRNIIPRGCCHPIFFSESYVDSWKCNFLGLPSDAEIPSHVLASDLHLCINIENGLIDNSSWHLTLHHCTTLPDKLPQVLVDIERAIQEKGFSENVLQSYLTSVKEIWMNKVKVLFTFSRAGHHSIEDTQKLLQVLGAQEQDKQLLKFWMTGLSTQYKTHVLSTSIQQKTCEKST